MKIIIAILLVILVFSKNVFASLKLNEIYPAPSTGEYEWIELYNDESQIIDISQYQLLDLAGNKIKISTQSALQFDFILATSSSILNNTGDTIYLKNNFGEIIEIATYSASFDPTKTYVKCPDGNGSWFVSNTLTKKNSNETACQILTPTTTLEPTLTITPMITGTDEPSPTILISYENIYISEVKVNPPTGEKEWVEIYNDNYFSVSLNNWFIDDQESAGSSPKTFSLIIDAKSYGVVDLTSSMFNNDGDSVRLLDFNRGLKDDFEYQKTESGKTLGRNSLESDNFCLQVPSKNSTNNPCINPTSTPITPTPTEKIAFPLTIKSISSGVPTARNNNFDVSIHRSINYPTGVIQNNYDNDDVLGITSDPLNNDLLLLRALSTISFSYSLLTIISILFKMKLSYGKNKNFYSSFVRSS